MNNKKAVFISILIGLATMGTLYFFFNDIVFHLRNVLSPHMVLETVDTLLATLKWIIVAIFGGGMVVFSYYFVLLRLPKGYIKLSKKQKIGSIIFSIFFSIYITSSLLLSTGDLLVKPLITWYNVSLFFILLLLFFTIFVLFVAIDGFESYNKKENVSIKRMFLYSIPIIIIWVLYLLS